MQHRDRDLAAVRYPMKQCGGSALDVRQCDCSVFMPVTVTEMSRLGTLGDVLWPSAMWSFA
jgi:hypothetical protein